MTRSVRFLAVAACVVAGLSGCVLRPQYLDLISQVEASEGPVAVTFLDAQTGEPIPNMSVSFGEGRDRVMLKTDASGTVIVPRERRFEQLNPVIVFDRPSNVFDVKYTVSEAPSAEQGQMHIPPGGVGPGQPNDRNQPAETPSTMGTQVGAGASVSTDGGTAQ